MSESHETIENQIPEGVLEAGPTIEESVPGAPPKEPETDPYAEFEPWKERVQKLFQMNKVPVPENADYEKPFEDGLTPWKAFLVIKSRAE